MYGVSHINGPVQVYGVGIILQVNACLMQAIQNKPDIQVQSICVSLFRQLDKVYWPIYMNKYFFLDYQESQQLWENSWSLTKLNKINRTFLWDFFFNCKLFLLYMYLNIMGFIFPSSYTDKSFRSCSLPLVFMHISLPVEMNYIDILSIDTAFTMKIAWKSIQQGLYWV